MVQEFSAGGIVFKKENGNTLWLVRRAKPNPEYRGALSWNFPHGGLDQGETMEQAALRETAEEGGVKARIVGELPTSKFFYTDKDKQKVRKFITYFLMEWLEDLGSGFGSETEEIKWLSKDEALGLLAYKNEKELLAIATTKIL